MAELGSALYVAQVRFHPCHLSTNGLMQNHFFKMQGNNRDGKHEKRNKSFLKLITDNRLNETKEATDLCNENFIPVGLYTRA